jgi:hypothetical protein
MCIVGGTTEAVAKMFQVMWQVSTSTGMRAHVWWRQRCQAGPLNWNVLETGKERNRRPPGQHLCLHCDVASVTSDAVQHPCVSSSDRRRFNN